MDIVIFFIALFSFAYLGSIFLGRGGKENHIFKTFPSLGPEYILLGFLLGPNISDILNNNILQQLNPIIALGIGWVGFLLGSQLSLQDLKKFPKHYYYISAGQSIVSYALVFLLAAAIFLINRKDITLFDIYAISILAATGAITTPIVMGFLSRNFIKRGEIFRMLYFVSSMDAIWVIVPFTLSTIFAVILFQENEKISFLILWALLSIVLGIFLGYFLRSFLRLKYNQNETLLLILGFLILGSGSAIYFNFSPLLVNFFCGVVIANTFEKKNQILEMSARYEKIFYILFLILAGALWKAPSVWIWNLFLLYFAGRIIGKYIGFFFTAKFFKSAFSANKQHHLGWTLLPQGGTSLAIALDFHQRTKGIWSEMILTILLITITVSLIFAPVILRKALPAYE